MFYLILEDNINLLISSYFKSSYIGSEPLFFHFFYYLSNYINSIYLYSLLIIISLLLCFIYTKNFFNLFLNRYSSLIMSLIFTFSPYFYYQSRSHLVLLQVWLLVFYVTNYIKLFYFVSRKHLKNYIYQGALLAILSLVSNYLGFVALLFTFSNFLILSIQSVKNKKYLFKNLLNFFTIIFTFIIIFLSFNYKIVFSNITNNKDNINNNLVINRPIEDFITFSNRPWFLITPSVDNPFFGHYSENIYNFFSNNFTNHLFNNYFKSEHSANYLGLINILIGLFGLYNLFRYKVENKNTLLNILLTSLVLLIFTLPPMFYLSGNKIYLPSYLIFYFLPMFRVLSRISILILLFTLIFTGIGYELLYKVLIKKMKNNIVALFILSLFITVSLLEFFIPLKFAIINNVPSVYEYLSNNIKHESDILVYPYSKTREAKFWYKNHKKNIVNDYGTFSKVGDTYYSNENLTKDIDNCDGLIRSLNLKYNYLIYFIDEKNKETYNFFINNLQTIYITENFENQSTVKHYLYEITNYGNSMSNRAILFKLEPEYFSEDCKKLYDNIYK